MFAGTGRSMVRVPLRLKLFSSELWQFRLPRLPVSFGWDTKSRWSLLSGVYARGSKRSHQSALECVTVVDSTSHSKSPNVRLCGARRCPAQYWEEEEVYRGFITSVTWDATIATTVTSMRCYITLLPTKFDTFLVARSQFDSDQGIDFYAYILPIRLCATAFCVCPLFLRQKNHHKCCHILLCLRCSFCINH